MLSLSQFAEIVRNRGTQTQAARELGVSRALVCQWLSGARKPSKTVLILASLLWGSNWPL